MTAQTSAKMTEAMRLVRSGASPYSAAKQAGVALSTMYRSSLYKEWKKEIEK